MNFKVVVSIIWTIIILFMIVADLNNGARTSTTVTTGVMLWIAGLIVWLIVSAAFKGKSSKSQQDGNSINNHSDVAQCPRCAEDIKKKAKICKHCGSEVEVQ